MAQLGAAAPRTAGTLRQAAMLGSDPYWLTMAVFDMLVHDVFIVVGCSTAVAFVVVLAATRSLRSAALCLLTISCVLSSLVGVMVGGFGLQLGMLESAQLTGETCPPQHRASRPPLSQCRGS